MKTFCLDSRAGAGAWLASQLLHSGGGYLCTGAQLAREVLALRNFVFSAPTRRRSGQLVVGPPATSFIDF